MNNVRFNFETPSPAEFLELYEATPWGHPAPLIEVESALAQTYLTSCARLDGQLVGVGRILSDGLLHAFLVDLIVADPHRGHGIGARLLDQLASELASRGIDDIQLMAADGRTAFYERAGFTVRAPGAPGMERHTTSTKDHT